MWHNDLTGLVTCTSMPTSVPTPEFRPQIRAWSASEGTSNSDRHLEAMAPTIRAALGLIYALTLFLYDRAAAVHMIRDFTATGMQTSQPESDDGSEIGDAGMPDLVWDHYG